MPPQIAGFVLSALILQNKSAEVLVKGCKFILLVLTLFCCQSFGQSSAKSCAGIFRPSLSPVARWARDLRWLKAESAKETDNKAVVIPRSKVQSSVDFLQQAMNKVEATINKSKEATTLDREVVRVLKQRIAKIQSEEKIPYHEFVLLCGHVSLALTRKIQLEGHSVLEKINNRVPHYEKDFKDIIDNPLANSMEFVKYGEIGVELEQINLAPQVGLFTKIQTLYLPTEKELGIQDFNSLYDAPVYFLGLSENVLMIDGTPLSPVEFFIHDTIHAINIRLVSDNWNETFMSDRIHLRQLYLDEIGTISDRRLRDTVETYWFFMFHEVYVPFNGEATKKYIHENQIKDGVLSPDDQLFLLRTQNPLDQAGNFQASQVPDAAMLNQAMNWILAILKN